MRDPLAWGVHPPAHLRDPSSPRRETPYVPRDIDRPLRQALTQGGFVLLLGESAAGKTRAAFEAVRACLPTHAWIRPFSRESIPTALQAVLSRPRSVLWLDDLEKYLGPGGLSEPTIRHLLDHHNGRIVLVAMRTEEHRRYDAREESRLTGADRDLWRTERTVVALAHTIRLERRWSPPEIDRAHHFMHDSRIGRALQAADRFGIAETLACGPLLLAAWQDAWACGANPRGAALVAAAVDCRRAGLKRPVPIAWIQEDHQPYLDARGGHHLRPEPFDAALAWACQPVRATSSLLAHDDTTGVTAFDYLLDTTDLAPIPEHLWAKLLPRLTAREAYDLGLVAQRDYRLRHALAALAQARQGQVAGADFALAVVTGDAGRPAEAARQLHALSQRHGQQVWHIRHQFAHFVGESGDCVRAAALFDTLFHDMVTAVGTDHPDTLAARHQAAFFTGEAGDPISAATQLDTLLTDRERALGTDHPQTLATRRSLAWFRGCAGDLDGAILQLEALLRDAQAALGPKNPHVLAVRVALSWFHGRHGQWAAAADQLHEVAQERHHVLGPEHPHTLAARQQSAVAWALAGNRELACRRLRELLTDMSRVLEPTHPHLDAVTEALDRFNPS